MCESLCPYTQLKNLHNPPSCWTRSSSDISCWDILRKFKKNPTFIAEYHFTAYILLQALKSYSLLHCFPLHVLCSNSNFALLHFNSMKILDHSSFTIALFFEILGFQLKIILKSLVMCYEHWYLGITNEDCITQRVL